MFDSRQNRKLAHSSHWKPAQNQLLPDAELAIGEGLENGQVWMVVDKTTGKVFTVGVVGWVVGQLSSLVESQEE